MQRIFRRRASGSPARDNGGLIRRLPAGLFRRRARVGRLPWGRNAAPVTGAPLATPPGDGAPTQETEVLVELHQKASFRDRGKLRRRLRFLRRARELAFRDVGGLIFDMRRFGRERPDLVDAKLSALGEVDAELRALERILDDRRPLHELHEPGISSCARCGALHSSEANFCPHCGLQIGGPRAMGEVGGAIAAPPQAPAAPARPAGSTPHTPPQPVAPPPLEQLAPTPLAPPPPPQSAARPTPPPPSSSASTQPTETMLPPRAPDES